jgi:hypothetical protein
MRHGFLTLAFQDDGDNTGKLLVVAEAEGYSGKGGAYFGIEQIVEFAKAIAEFPLPDRSRCALASGFWSKGSPGKLEQEHVGIDVYPIDHRGHIGVQVRMSTPIWNDTRRASQKTAKFEIVTTYQVLANFSSEILAMLGGRVPEAILLGEMLP